MTAIGLALLLVGALAVLAEAHVPTLGVVGAPGVVAMTIGTALALTGLGGGLVVVLIAAVVVAAAGVAGIGLSIQKGAAVSRRRVSTGAEGLVGRVGVGRRGTDAAGKVEVDGALWKARADWLNEEPAPLRAGDSIVVERVRGLTLAVRPAEEWELSP
jgi:membrane-bound ClpP family serine protease